jgi:DNA-binding transcriptional ArsR family regulator
MNFHKMERLVRAYSNHRRIQILDLLQKQPELSVEEVSAALKINHKTGSEHIRRLAIGGLVLKRSEGNAVRHALTPLGRTILKFLRTLA